MEWFATKSVALWCSVLSPVWWRIPWVSNDAGVSKRIGGRGHCSTHSNSQQPPCAPFFGTGQHAYLDNDDGRRASSGRASVRPSALGGHNSETIQANSTSSSSFSSNSQSVGQPGRPRANVTVLVWDVQPGESLPSFTMSRVVNPHRMPAPACSSLQLRNEYDAWFCTKGWLYGRWPTEGRWRLTDCGRQG